VDKKSVEVDTTYRYIYVYNIHVRKEKGQQGKVLD